MNQRKQTIVKSKRKIPILCNECNRKRTRLDESHQICNVCYKAKKKLKLSGNKVIDDFIRYTQINCTTITVSKFKFIPYDRFENVEFIAEGGFSKIYKATMTIRRRKNDSVVLKKLNNSKNVTSKELNELKVSYELSLKNAYNVCEYFGITQDPITQDIMIIMPYYGSGDLINYFITNDFYSITWRNKLDDLQNIARGLGCDLGISKFATESTDDNNENYGIIPYIAPEIFRGKKYTTASDIYSFGMIMWEFITGRRPFWNKIHNVELIIEICDGLRPPIVTNTPNGYIELMNECWHPDPKKRPSTNDLVDKIWKMERSESINDYFNTPTKIIKSPDIGPVTMNNPGAIYKSRPLSGMIQSAMSTRSLRSQSINLEAGENIKKKKLIEDENNDYYYTKELELDVDTNFKQHKKDYEYKTQEIGFDIDTF